MDECVLAIDLTHRSLTVALVGCAGLLGEPSSLNLEELAPADKPELALDRMLTLLSRKAKTAPAAPRRAFLSVTGELDQERARILRHHPSGWLDGQALPEKLSAALGLPVSMERREVVLLSCDRALLSLPEDALVVGCYIDDHYESAIWNRGAMILGRNGLAGNASHLPIHGREDICSCGRIGCADLYCAGVRLRQIHGMIFTDTPLDEIFMRHWEHPIIRDYLSMMAYPVAFEAKLLDHDFIILGGSVPALAGFPLADLEQEVLDHLNLAGGHPPAFIASATDAVTGVVCAGRYAFMLGGDG